MSEGRSNGKGIELNLFELFNFNNQSIINECYLINKFDDKKWKIKISYLVIS